MLVTTDNNCGNCQISELQATNLQCIADTSINNLIKNKPNLLVFPDCLKASTTNTDKIYEDTIFSITDCTLTTNNIMGFIGVHNTKLKIQSRFAQESEKSTNDYFLHYMLQKVFCINLFDLQHSYKQEPVFDFLSYLFPYFLKKALVQGLYKQYQKKNYNNTNIKGSIDLPSHLKQNLPFKGTLAYQVREHSFDNPITQLVRHTIEHIKHSAMRHVLYSDNDLLSFLNQIVQHTPSYNIRDRQKILQLNAKPLVHPYFTEYVYLQNICLRILNFESINYANGTQDIYGILFDGAWLWEEYLNTLLKDINFIHPENKTKQDSVRVFSNKDTGYNLNRYPDFYSKDKKMVLDAKYKRMENNPNRDDVNQIISYMYILKSEVSGFLTPTIEPKSKFIKLGTLSGHGGTMHKWQLSIPQYKNSFKDFTEQMQSNEKEFISYIKQMNSEDSYTNKEADT